MSKQSEAYCRKVLKQKLVTIAEQEHADAKAALEGNPGYQELVKDPEYPALQAEFNRISALYAEKKRKLLKERWINSKDQGKYDAICRDEQIELSKWRQKAWVLKRDYLSLHSDAKAGGETSDDDILTDYQQQVYNLIESKGPIMGNDICKQVGGSPEALRSHTIPFLKKKRGILNKPKTGYYLPKRS